MRWATTIRLYQVVHGSKTSQLMLQTAVSNILSAVSIIQPGAKAEAHLLFPLFMAGVSTTLKPQRLTIEYRMSVIESTVGIGNITGVHQLLDAVWLKSKDDTVNVDWELLMHTEHSGVMLF
jgi:hypothetical protein